MPCNNTLHPKYTSLNFNHRPNGYISQPLVASFSTAPPPQLNAFLASGHTSQPLVASSLTAPPPQLTAFPASGHISQPLVASSVSAEHFRIARLQQVGGHIYATAATSQHICTSNFNNIFNPRLHAFPATSTLLPSLSWSQHLLPSSSHRRISIAFSVLCVHPGPASSHISQPLVASFDKTATAPQTEQY